jgi:glucan 1,3-beta-glucosidase
MSNNDPARNVAYYDPLPLTSDDQPSNTLYNAPPSPDPRLSSFHTPQMTPSELGPDDSTIPLGAAQPRFLGAALYDGPGSPSMRNSFASSQHTIPNSVYGSSVYALNDSAGQGRFEGSYRDDPHDSYYAGEHGDVPMSPVVTGHRILEEKRAAYIPPRTKSRRHVMIAAIIVAILLIILAVVIPLYLFVVKPSNKGSSSIPSSHSAHPSSTASVPRPSAVAVTGGDGSLITMEDGTTFTYKNKFGGTWYWDHNDPFNNGARPQSWSPALNETFRYGIDKIRGYVYVIT